MALLPTTPMAPSSIGGTPKDRKTEFARLLNFFDHLASRGKSKHQDPGATPTKPSAMSGPRHELSFPFPAPPSPTPRDMLPIIPSDITPVVANLTKVNRLRELYESAAATTTMASRTPKPLGTVPTDAHSRVGGDSQIGLGSVTGQVTAGGPDTPERPRRITISGNSSPSPSSTRPSRTMTSPKAFDSFGGHESDMDVEEDGDQAIDTAPTFPLPNSDSDPRPFTFRLMLHNLYGKEDWIKKVKEALEESKKAYKPLSEYSAEAATVRDSRVGVDGPRSGPGTSVHFASGQRSSGSRAGGGASGATHTRQRSISATTPTALPLTPNNTQYPTSAVKSTAHSARAVKKRCIGRRKSLNGPLNNASNDNGEFGGSVQRGLNAWVYDAMVSQLEQESQNSLRRSKGRCRAASVSAGVVQIQEPLPRIRATTLSLASGGVVVGGEKGVGIGRRALTTAPSKIMEDVGKAGLKRRLGS